MVNEAYARGIKFLKPSLTKSHASWFLPEDGAIRCPFSSMGGLGDAAAQSIYEACQSGEILSVEDLRMKAEIGKGVIEIMRKNGVFDDVSETNQLDMFGTTASSSAPVPEAPKPKKSAEKPASSEEDNDEQISLF
jgi:DNA polymerase-3 subunit alpha (Gram-positive type)